MIVGVYVEGRKKSNQDIKEMCFSVLIHFNLLCIIINNRNM